MAREAGRYDATFNVVEFEQIKMKGVTHWKLNGDSSVIYEKLQALKPVKVMSERAGIFTITMLPLFGGVQGECSTNGYRIEQHGNHIKSPILSEENMVHWIKTLRLA